MHRIVRESDAIGLYDWARGIECNYAALYGDRIAALSDVVTLHNSGNIVFRIRASTGPPSLSPRRPEAVAAPLDSLLPRTFPSEHPPARCFPRRALESKVVSKDFPNLPLSIWDRTFAGITALIPGRAGMHVSHALSLHSISATPSRNPLPEPLGSPRGKVHR